jgi:hypothetical protein
MYLVGHDLRGLSPAQLAGGHWALPEVVRAVNDIAEFPLARVVAVQSSVPRRTRSRTRYRPDHGLSEAPAIGTRLRFCPNRE